MEKKYLDIFSKIRENTNPKVELNHYFIDNENIVVTDTRMLAILKHGEEIDSKHLLLNPKFKLGMDWDKEDGFYDLGPEVLKKKKLLDEPNKEDNSYFYKYPDYKRIIPQTESKYFRRETRGLDALYQLTFDHGIVFDFVKFSPRMKALDKIYFKSYRYSEKTSPIMFENDEFIFIIMPLIMREE